jgi:hypothetical protein
MRSSAVLGIVSVTLAAACVFPAQGQARVVITEVMFNPNSKEDRGETEWVEIANVGNESITMKDWMLDDEDRGNWGLFTCTLAPGGVAVLINGEAVKEDEFRAAWDDAGSPLNYQVLAIQWGGISNTPSKDNEVLQLLDDKDTVICEVRQAEGWPKVGKPDGPSIWLTEPKAADTNVGKLWHKSEAGKDGVRENKKAGIFAGKDCGSPGYVPGLSPAPAASAPAAATQPASTQPDALKSKDNKIEY